MKAAIWLVVGGWWLLQVEGAKPTTLVGRMNRL